MNMSTPPVYLPEFRTLGVLQQLQVLLGAKVTLGDVAVLVAGFQKEFGADAELEDVIQTLVVRQLVAQWQNRLKVRSIA